MFEMMKMHFSALQSEAIIDEIFFAWKLSDYVIRRELLYNRKIQSDWIG